MAVDQRSEQAGAYRHLYKTARWRSTRADQLARQPLCETCLSQGRITAATVCNHIDKDAKATEEGFYAGPFTSLCAPHHDSTQQRIEKRGHGIGCDASGMPLDPNHHWNR
jgi:5-methylcytosine-specific restriction protein A